MDTSEIQVMEELAASTSIAEEQCSEAPSTESSHWTSFDRSPRSEQDSVRKLPGYKVPKFGKNRFQLLEKIGEGGQGCVYSAKFSLKSTRDHEAGYVQGREENLTSVDVAGSDELVLAAKIFKGGLHDSRFGQWSDELFGIHGLCNFICRFHGYCIDGDSFWLIMDKYDCSLRDSIDKHMKMGTYKGRPFHGAVALSIIIQIALGMDFLHQRGIIHGDLKADNIFILILGDGDDTPTGVFIADFDVSSSMQGTLFWRAPEILQVLKNGASGRKLPLTTKSDVYSFGMVCYEILTGGIPFKGSRFGDYDMVLSGKRPELPSNLNHKMKDLLTRCWHNEPDARPTFKDIVSELQGFVAGTAFLMQLFTFNDAFDGVGDSDLEYNLMKVKQLTHVLVEKYNHGSFVLTDTTEDFIVLAFEYVDHLEEFKAQFGLESFMKHPSLPSLEEISRSLLYYKIRDKGSMFRAACPTVIPEYSSFLALMTAFVIMPQWSQSTSNSEIIDIEENLTEEEKALVWEGIATLDKEMQRQAQLDYANQHDICHKVLTEGIASDSGQPCNFCKNLPFYVRQRQVLLFQLYDSEDRSNVFKRTFAFLDRNSKRLFELAIKFSV